MIEIRQIRPETPLKPPVGIPAGKNKASTQRALKVPLNASEVLSEKRGEWRAAFDFWAKWLPYPATLDDFALMDEEAIQILNQHGNTRLIHWLIYGAIEDLWNRAEENEKKGGGA